MEGRAPNPHPICVTDGQTEALEITDLVEGWWTAVLAAQPRAPSPTGKTSPGVPPSDQRPIPTPAPTRLAGGRVE